jgi:hypothetical protein
MKECMKKSTSTRFSALASDVPWCPSVGKVLAMEEINSDPKPETNILKLQGFLCQLGKSGWKSTTRTEIRGRS